MIKKLFLIGFLIIFLTSSLSLFVPVLYLRYEIKNYLNRYLTEAVIQSDSEIKKNITSFLMTLDPEIEVFELEVSREKNIRISLVYQQKACLGFLPKKTCLFPIRSSLSGTHLIS